MKITKTLPGTQKYLTVIQVGIFLLTLPATYSLKINNIIKNLLFGAATIMLMASCAGNGVSEKTKEDSIRIADSIAQVEATRQAEEAAMAAEQARLDSIRRDSLAKEEEMRINPNVFWTIGGTIQTSNRNLKKYRFKKIKKIKTPIDPENNFYEETIIYRRAFNGRKVDYENSCGDCCIETMTFYDKADLDAFIEELEKSGYKNNGKGEYRKASAYSISIKGMKAFIENCG